MFCKNCGAALPEGARFCGACGTPVAAAAAAEEAVEAAETAAEEVNAAAEEAGAAVAEAEQKTEAAFETAQEAAEDTVAEAVEAAETVEAEAAAAAEETVAQAEDVANDAAGEVREAVENTAEQVQEAAQNAEEQLNVVTEPVYSEPEIQPDNANAYQPAGVQPAGNYGYAPNFPPVPPTAPVKTKTKERKPRKKAGAGAHIAAVFICILLFAFLVATLAVATVQNAVTESAINDAISRTHIDSLKVEDLFDETQVKSMGLDLKSGSDTLIDFLYDNIDQSNFAEPLSREDFRKIALSDEFRDFVAMTISRRASKVIDGIKTNVVDVDEIISFVRSQRDYLSDVIGYKITDTEIDNLRTMLEENYGEALSKLEIQPMNKYVNEGAASAIRLVFSKWILIVLIVVVVLLMALIFLVIRSAKHGLMYNGVTFVVAGLPFVLAAAAFSIGLIPIKSSESIVQFLLLAAGAISRILILLGSIVVAAGIIMIVASCITRSVQNKKQRKQYAA